MICKEQIETETQRAELLSATRTKIMAARMDLNFARCRHDETLEYQAKKEYADAVQREAFIRMAPLTKH